jgi:hypothetical protein
MQYFSGLPVASASALEQAASTPARSSAATCADVWTFIKGM